MRPGWTTVDCSRATTVPRHSRSARARQGSAARWPRRCAKGWACADVGGMRLTPPLVPVLSGAMSVIAAVVHSDGILVAVDRGAITIGRTGVRTAAQPAADRSYLTVNNFGCVMALAGTAVHLGLAPILWDEIVKATSSCPTAFEAAGQIRMLLIAHSANVRKTAGPPSDVATCITAEVCCATLIGGPERHGPILCQVTVQAGMRAELCNVPARGAQFGPDGSWTALDPALLSASAAPSLTAAADILGAAIQDVAATHLGRRSASWECATVTPGGTSRKVEHQSSWVGLRGWANWGMRVRPEHGQAP